ncbi:MAG: HAMP domain-containing protein, partial [Deltaproteobacteria bacterium]|nr:HAMP domain-containing protein [Deltaproteobacteria bacterium]
MPGLPTRSATAGRTRGSPELRGRSIRWKLFGLISLVVVVPVVALVVYFPATQMAQIRRDLVIKARSFAAVVAQDLSSSTRSAGPGRRLDYEAVLSGVLVDPDVLGVAFSDAQGQVVARVGDVTTRSASAPAGPHEVTSEPTSTELEDRLIVSVPVALEAPGTIDGALRVDLARTRVIAEGASVRATAVLVGLVAIALGCFLAWMVGSVLGRRIETIRAHAMRVAAGDLSVGPPVDSGRDELGEMARALRSMVEVVEREVSERTAALNASNDQLKMLLETTHTVPWQLEIGTWRFLYVGPQVHGIFGVPAEVWARHDFWETHVHPSDRARVQAELERAVIEDRPTDLEMRLTQPETNNEKWVRLLVGASSPRENQRPRLESLEIRGFLLDVTRQRLLELELRQAQRLESVGRLSNGIAHELNTPIQYVSDSLHFVREACADLSPLITRYLELKPVLAGAGLGKTAEELAELEVVVDADYSLREIPKALSRSLDGLQRVTRIVQSMRTFASADVREKAPADLNLALEATLRIANHEISNVAELETSFAALPRVECHGAELNQVFLGIVLNACEAMAPVVAETGVLGKLRVSSRVVDDGGEGVRARPR